MDKTNNSSEHQGHNFTTFSGVFTPSILTIFGLVMFMLTGTVIGQAGIFWALVILLVAQTITLSTGLSISAISTNTPVKGGGAYFLISRALGPGFGSSIGITLFLAQALSIPFYILGFTGALTQNFPSLDPYYLWIALGTGIIIFIVTWIGAGWAIKCQYVILAILVLAILAFLGGAATEFSVANFKINMLRPENGAVPITLIFATFFPAVTGIMAGVNMSGDLKEPAKSIPKGTLAAIFVATAVYGLQIIVCGGAFSREDLISKPYLLLVENALLGTGFLVIAGVISATLSSALGSMLGAPRVLQALAQDKIIRILNPFARGVGPHNEPRVALILSMVITVGVLIWGGLQGIGSLGTVASVITMFFLYTYGMVNLAAFVESYGANPSFRPRFRYYHWTTALFGACACVWVSFMIDAVSSIVALTIIAILFSIARRKSMEMNFGDARRGFIFTQIRNNLILLSKMPPDPKNWRPTIVVLTGNPNTRFSLLEYSSLFECKRGILSLVEFVVGEFNDVGEKRLNELKRLNDFSRQNDISFFPEVIVTENFDHALTTFIQAHSIGPVKPNIVMLGWPNELKRIKPYVRHLRMILELNMSCVAFVNPMGKQCPKFPSGRIDIWWRGQTNGSLMLILAYLLTRNANWSKVKLRILRTTNEKKKETAKKDLDDLVESSRITAEVKIVVSDTPFNTTFKRESADAILLILGFVPVGDNDAESFYNSYSKRLIDMPPAFLVSSSGEAELQA